MFALDNAFEICLKYVEKIVSSRNYCISKCYFFNKQAKFSSKMENVYYNKWLCSKECSAI